VHRLLKRQLDRHAPGGASAGSSPWSALIEAVDAAYVQYDEDRAMLERSLELSSEELLQTNSELRVLVQAFPDLFFRIDLEGTILDRKGGEADDFYADQHCLKGKRIQDIPVPEVRARFTSALEKARAERTLVSVEYALESNGMQRHYEARIMPLLQDQLMVIIRNITHRKNAEKELREKARELERSNGELEQFAYVASHDLQEPLRSVQSYLQLLKRRYGEKLDQDADEFIDFAVDGAKRMRQLIEDLLTYSRVSSRGRPPEPTNLDEVVDHVMRGLSAAVEECGATITRDPLPCINGDRAQLKQLYQNLISNALKFRKDNAPHVKLSAEKEGAFWRLGVSDDGIGMNPKYAEKVFEIFKRLHSKDEYEGTGIGLAICKKIVERHGGRIWVESRLGEGSTFCFTLPMTTS
jgi:signal transduction histidine kinase